MENKYEKNGTRKNIAILCTKVDAINDKLKDHSKKLDRIVEVLPSVKTKSKINFALIMVIIVALVGLAFKVIGG